MKLGQSGWDPGVGGVEFWSALNHEDGVTELSSSQRGHDDWVCETTSDFLCRS